MTFSTAIVGAVRVSLNLRDVDADADMRFDDFDRRRSLSMLIFAEDTAGASAVDSRYVGGGGGNGKIQSVGGCVARTRSTS